MERVYFFQIRSPHGAFPKGEPLGIVGVRFRWTGCPTNSVNAMRHVQLLIKSLNDCEVNLSQAVWFLVRGHGSTLAKQSVMSRPQVLRVWSVVTYEVILLNTRSKLLTFTTYINSRFTTTNTTTVTTLPLSPF